MRLYLSSFRLGDHPEALVALLERGKPAAVIANALDAEEADERAAGVQLELDALASLGIEAEELDLRDFFERRERLPAALARFGLAWLRGGNVFVLRAALAASGADEALTELLRRDALVFGGYSAGPCVLAPSLRGLELVDDPGAVATAYGLPVVWGGLGVLQEAFVPHFDSVGHPEADLVREVAARYRAEGVPHRTLRDGQALVVDGETTVLR